MRLLKLLFKGGSPDPQRTPSEILVDNVLRNVQEAEEILRMFDLLIHSLSEEVSNKLDQRQKLQSIRSDLVDQINSQRQAIGIENLPE